MAKTYSAARMARLVAQWRKSDESGASFARPHRIPAWPFWYWQRKLPAAPAPEPPRATFVPVQVAVDETPVIEVVLSGGERLQVRAGASADLAGGRQRAAVGVLTLSPAVRIYLATGATDLRRSIDGFGSDPLASRWTSLTRPHRSDAPGCHGTR